MDAALLVRDARLVPLDGEQPGPALDVRISAGRVTEVGSGLPSRGEPELDAAGRWVLPGLWDAHVHFTQAAKASQWFDASAATSPGALVALVAEHVAALGPGADPHRTITGFGFRANSWGEPADTAALDAVSAGHPVALIAGDAHTGWLNSRAVALLGAAEVTGALSENPWFALFARLDELPGFAPDDAVLARYLGTLAARGIVGVVDVEFADAVTDWPPRLDRGLDLVRVRAGVYEHQLEDVLQRGLRTGDPLHPSGLATMGPLKVIGDGSLGSGTAWCCDGYHGATPPPAGAGNIAPDRLVGLATRAARAGLEMAIHGIGDRAVTAALDAFAASGATGSVEHAQLLADPDVARFAGLGVRASMQPAHLLDDRDATDRLWPDRAERCFRFRDLVDAGADVRLGSDAPIAPADPWLAIAAAVHRSADDREPWHPNQSLTVAEALAASVDGVRLAVGAPGDLVVLGADPLAPGLSGSHLFAHLRDMPVLATVCAGRPTHLSPGLALDPAPEVRP